MAVTRRTRVTPVEEEKPAQVPVITRRRPVKISEAPAEESPTTAIKVRRRSVAAPSPELIQALEIIESVAQPTESKVIGTDYDRIIRDYKARATTPKNAIRAMCVECMGGMIAEVNRCTSDGCALHPFRLGKNPFHALSKDNKDNQK